MVKKKKTTFGKLEQQKINLMKKEDSESKKFAPEYNHVN